MTANLSLNARLQLRKVATAGKEALPSPVLLVEHSLHEGHHTAVSLELIKTFIFNCVLPGMNCLSQSCKLLLLERKKVFSERKIVDSTTKPLTTPDCGLTIVL